MKEQFADYEIAKMLKELKFNTGCIGLYDNDTKELLEIAYNESGFPEESDLYTNFSDYQTSAPTWQQVEQWLWDKHRTWINVIEWSQGFEWQIMKTHNIIAEKLLNKNNSPIAAKIEGIKSAVKYLYEQSQKL